MKVKETVIKTYIATDGTEFDTEEDCLYYEKEQAEKTLSREEAKFILNNFNVLSDVYNIINRVCRCSDDCTGCLFRDQYKECIFGYPDHWESHSVEYVKGTLEGYICGSFKKLFINYLTN